MNICRSGVFALSALLGAGTAMAHGFGGGSPRFGNPVAVPNVNLPAPSAEGCPIESEDGLSLFLASNRAGTLGLNDIWTSDRKSIDSPWDTPKNIGAPINSPFADFCPTPVYGRSLFFVTDRPDNGGTTPPCGGGDMYLTRQSPSGAWADPVMLKCAPEGPNFPATAAGQGQERSPSLVETWFGTFLFYSSTAGGINHDIYMSQLGRDGHFGPGKKVRELSTPEYDEIMPNVRGRDDGSFEIVFSSNRPVRIDGTMTARGQDVYYARSWWLTAHWSNPENVGEHINTAGTEQRATLSRDGKRLYFGRDGDLFVSERRSGGY